jgi:hypothetical protein
VPRHRRRRAAPGAAAPAPARPSSAPTPRASHRARAPEGFWRSSRQAPAKSGLPPHEPHSVAVIEIISKGAWRPSERARADRRPAAVKNIGPRHHPQRERPPAESQSQSSPDPTAAPEKIRCNSWARWRLVFADRNQPGIGPVAGENTSMLVLHSHMSALGKPLRRKEKRIGTCAG